MCLEPRFLRNALPELGTRCFTAVSVEDVHLSFGVQRMKEFMRQEHRPKHCPEAVSVATPHRYWDMVRLERPQPRPLHSSPQVAIDVGRAHTASSQACQRTRRSAWHPSFGGSRNDLHVRGAEVLSFR